MVSRVCTLYTAIRGNTNPGQLHLPRIYYFLLLFALLHPKKTPELLLCKPSYQRRRLTRQVTAYFSYSECNSGQGRVGKEKGSQTPSAGQDNGKLTDRPNIKGRISIAARRAPGDEFPRRISNQQFTNALQGARRRLSAKDI